MSRFGRAQLDSEAGQAWDSDTPRPKARFTMLSPTTPSQGGWGPQEGRTSSSTMLSLPPTLPTGTGARKSRKPFSETSHLIGTAERYAASAVHACPNRRRYICRASQCGRPVLELLTCPRPSQVVRRNASPPQENFPGRQHRASRKAYIMAHAMSAVWRYVREGLPAV